MLAALADLSVIELLLIAGMAIVASIIGGVAGYGTGALMPLVLVPIVGRRAGGADHRDLGAVHQLEPLVRVPRRDRLAARGHHHRHRAADHDARRVGLHHADRPRRDDRDRHA